MKHYGRMVVVLTDNFVVSSTTSLPSSGSNIAKARCLTTNLLIAWARHQRQQSYSCFRADQMYILIDHWLTTVTQRTNDLHNAGTKGAQKPKKPESRQKRSHPPLRRPSRAPTPGSSPRESLPELEHYLQTREILELQLVGPPQCHHHKEPQHSNEGPHQQDQNQPTSQQIWLPILAQQSRLDQDQLRKTLKIK